jgi:drug/metabolite transporter (DMT)-like permease
MQFCLGATSCYYLAGANPLGPPAKRKWLTIRGLMGFISFSCYYYAMSRLTLADSTTIMFSSPLYTGILGWIFLRERVSKFDISLTLISIVGVLMVVRPRALFGDQGDLEAVPVGAEDDSALLHTMGLMAAIAGSIVSAFVYVAIRKVGPGVNPLVLVSYMVRACLVYAAP